MGSIAAFLARHGLPDPDVVKRMLVAAPHRGDEVAHAVVGHAVVGASWIRGHAGASLEHVDGWAAAFAGELDNRLELSRELGATGSSAAVVLQAFRRWGEQAPRRLRGAFVATVTDGEKLWSFRDQVGFVPLHLRDVPRGCYVATEAKQVAAGAELSLEPNLDVVERIYFGDPRDDSPSALAGVDRVQRSHLSRADAHRAVSYRYWDPTEVFETAGPDTDVVGAFEHLMGQAAGRVLRGSDVVSLSGGIDSPAVAAFAAPIHLERYEAPLAALSEVFPDHPTVDERPYIELVAARLGMTLHTYTPGPRRLTDLDRWAELCDGPIPTWSPNDDAEYYQKATELGYRNILMGDLAEVVSDVRRHSAGHLLWSGRWNSLLDHMRRRKRNGAPIQNIAREVLSALTPRRVQLLYMKLRPDFLGSTVPPWLDRKRVNAVWDDLCIPASKRYRRAQLYDFLGPPGTIMEAQDTVQSQAGVRARHPWADLDLWAFFLSLPVETKFPERGRKVLPRRLLRSYVPDEILDRTDKTVFNDWLMGDLDYPNLKRWLQDPPHRMPGVDYRVLNERIDARQMSFYEYTRAQDLAFVHAFLSRW